MAAITVPGMFLTGDHASRPAASAVGGGSLYSCTDHDLIYQSDTSSWTTWATLGGGGGGGGLTLVEQHTASNSANLSFTTAFTSTYDEYLIELVGIVPATNNVDLRLSFSSNGGSSYDSSSNYFSARTGILNDGTEVNVQNGNPTTFFVLGTGLANTASRGISASLRLMQPLSTTYDKTMYGTVAFTNQSNLFGGLLSCMLTVAATAYNAIQFVMSSGNISAGTIRIYGIEK